MGRGPRPGPDRKNGRPLRLPEKRWARESRHRRPSLPPGRRRRGRRAAGVTRRQPVAPPDAGRAADELKVFLVTSENTDGPEKLQKQMEFLLRVKQAAAVAGITLDVKFDGTIHDRSIVANSGWRINLGRGLDIFQYVANDAFDLAVKLQQYRQVKAFGVTYIREASAEAP
ncbi:MAG: hypothetical protein EOO67_11155 [Microbacterium sp.]|nr:MAG: hypothetical protein EOO67_11155 [Microbacterium sp.]